MSAPLTQAQLEAAVQREIDRYGSLDAAISGLANDSCGAPWGAPIHAILSAALKLRSGLRASAQKAA